MEVGTISFMKVRTMSLRVRTISVDKCWDDRIMSLMSRDNAINECWDNVIDESLDYDIDVS